MKQKKLPLMIALVILIGVSGFFTSFFTANNTLRTRQYDEDHVFQNDSIPSSLTTDEHTSSDGTQKVVSSPENPGIDPIGEGVPLSVEEYLINTTTVQNIVVGAEDSTNDFYGMSPSSVIQDSPMVYGDFAFYNIRNETVDTKGIEEYTLHSLGFSNLYAQGFNVTSEFKYYYLKHFIIGKVVFYGGGGSFTIEVRNSTEYNLPSDEVFFFDTYAYGALGEIADIAFVIDTSLLLRTNRTYFIVFSANNCDWYYVGDSSLGDTVDDGIACHHDGNAWVVSQPAIPGGETIDFALQEIGYQTAFFSETIGLEINGTQVKNQVFDKSVGGEVVMIHDPPLYPNGTGYFNFDLTIDPIFNVAMDVNFTLRYLWDTKQTNIPAYRVLNRTIVTWNASFDVVIPIDSDLSRGNISWYNYSFMIKDQNADWNGTIIYDPIGTELTDFCEVKNGSYVYVTPATINAALVKDGNWVIQYSSPNYLDQLSISPVTSLYNSSDTVTVSAALIDGGITSGTILLNFTSPDGEILYSQEGGVPSNGLVNFDPFVIPDETPDGNYTILVLFEGNLDTLNEIGFMCRNITVDGLETAPVTTIAPSDTTIQSTILISLSADDGAGVGVEYTQYRIDGGVWSNYTAPFDFSTYGEGIFLVEYNSTDLYGNREQTKNITYVVDDSSPETSIVPIDLTITSSMPIALTAVDVGGSDIDSIGYRIDGGSWLNYSGSFTLASGTHVIEYNSTDNSGNVEQVHIKTYVVDDTTPPVTNIIPSSSAIRTDTFIILNATDDGAGVNRTEYRIDEGIWDNYTTPFSLPLGAHLVEFNSIDNAGNIETVNSHVYIVDDDPPSTTAIPDNSNSITTETQIILSADDVGGAGVATIAYRINGGAWQTHSLAFILPYGTCLLEFNATDHAGNVELTNEMTYVVEDQLAPTTVISPLDETITSSDQIQLTTTDNDNGSGVLETWYRIDDDPDDWIFYTTPFTLPVGNYTIEFYSIDTALNTESVTQFNYTVENTPPNTTITPDQQYIQPFTSLTLEANDTGGSGVSEIYYRIDGGGFSQIWVLYDSPFVLDPGFHVVEYYAIDFSGNTEAIHLTNYTIDGAAPVTSVNVSTSLLNTTTVIEIISSDALAGVDYIAYKLNDGDWWIYYEPFTLYEGDYTLYYNATDLAGNEEWTKSITFTIEDITPPVTEIDPSNDTIVEGTYIYLWAEDDWTGSGVSMILFSINTAPWVVYEGGFALSENGTYTITYFAMDFAGNNEIENYKIYEVVEEINEDGSGDDSSSGNSGGGGVGATTSYIEVITEDKDYAPRERVIITGKLNGGGNYAAGKLVFVECNGNVFNTTTNEDGVFKFAVTSPTTYGNYCVTAWFEGDSDWKPSSCTCAFLVVEQDSILTVDVNGVLEENNTVTIKLKLKTEDGKAMPNEQLTVVIYAIIESSVEIESSTENDLSTMGDSEGWEVIYETVAVTNEQGNAQLLFTVPTSRDLKIVAFYEGYADEDSGYIGASNVTFVKGQPKVVNLGILSMTTDVLAYVIGAFAIVGVGAVLVVLQKAGIFFQLRHGELITFTDQVNDMLGKRKTILLDEIALNTDLSVDEVVDRLAESIAEGLLYGLIDIATNEFIDISFEDELKLKEMLRGYLKHHKGVFDIHELAKRCKMRVDHLLRWLKLLYNSGEIDGKVVRSKKDPDRYRYVIATRVL